MYMKATKDYHVRKRTTSARRSTFQRYVAWKRMVVQKSMFFNMSLAALQRIVYLHHCVGFGQEYPSLSQALKKFMISKKYKV